ncbi:MAG: imidazolonepropionase [Pyramidobacter sp.]|nr:imidazolonepropionase [Pyramidobacter sp.]
MSGSLYRGAAITTPLCGSRPSAGAEQGRTKTWENGSLLVIDGIIKAVGDDDEVMKAADALDSQIDEEVDCEGACMIPGFVDPHTHICFAARREKEFGMRLEGKTYLEILNAGGGILSSVRAVKEATEEELYETTLDNVLSALSHGTTTMEIKSGYGLCTEEELKMLRVIKRIGEETPLDIVPTFMGAHAVPTEYKSNPDAFVDIIVNEMLPAVKAQGIADCCDVFCETGVYTIEQSRRILLAARDLGMKLRIHADEVDDTGGAGLAAQLRTVSAEHLLAASESNLRAMAAASVIADVLPATAYSLRKPYAPARKMIELGVPVALASDCNPGSCFCESMPFVFGLAVMNMGMTVSEALVGCTLNAAWSVGLQDKVGSLEVGKQADFLLLDGDSPAVLAYHAGVNPVMEVYKRGVFVS